MHLHYKILCSIKYVYCIMKQCLGSYFIQTSVGIHSIVTERRCCFEQLPKFSLFYLKNKRGTFSISQ